MQCHLEGLSRIARRGHRVDDFRAGQRLSDVLTVFVSAAHDHQTPGAVSHVESLAASRCKQASGDRMTCTTCHDPHRTPAASERDTYYRQRCLSCHAALASDHHANERSCTTCHMPRLDSPDVAHTAVTDHRILKRPRADREPPAAADVRLAPFGATEAAPRDLGLAYAEIAPRGGTYGEQRAVELLEQSSASQPDDPEVLTRLGFLRQERGHAAEAAELYRRALETGATKPVAAANLAIIRAQQGALGEALELWQAGFTAQPYVEEIGLNLALGQCLAGAESKAAATIDRLLLFVPDSDRARALRGEIEEKNHCAHHRS
jgi:predicted CXXCH cytochrome family protein